MPDYTVRWIIGRALNDPHFRDLMARSPRKAWEGYDLTQLDLSELKSWTPERIQAVLADLNAQLENAVFNDAAGFVLDDSSAPNNCEDGFSMTDFQKLFGLE